MALGRGTIAHLAGHVVAPALDAAIGRERAVVPVSGRDRGDIERGGRPRRRDQAQVTEAVSRVKRGLSQSFEDGAGI